MNRFDNFARARRALARAAAEGTLEAAQSLAQTLREGGASARTESDGRGGASVVLTGAGVVAREFGTRTSPARPVLGPAVQANRGRIFETIARKIAGAARETRS